MNLSSMRSRRRWPNVQSRGCRGNTPPVEMVLAYGSTCSVFKSGLFDDNPTCLQCRCHEGRQRQEVAMRLCQGWLDNHFCICSFMFIHLLQVKWNAQYPLTLSTIQILDSDGCFVVEPEKKYIWLVVGSILGCAEKVPSFGPTFIKTFEYYRLASYL